MMSPLEPLVSVVIPSYNHGAYIAEAIRSALDQTYGNIEVIVVDNHSTDDSWVVINSFDDGRIRPLRFDNGGVIAAGRNHGAGHARGEIISFLDSDDIWRGDKLSVQVPELLRDGAALVGSAFHPIGDVMYCRNHLHFRRGEEHRDYTYLEVALGNPIMTSSAVMRMDLFRQLGGFDESPEFRFIEDWELWLRASRTAPVRVLAAPLIEYRIAVGKDRDTRDVTMRTLAIFAKHERLGYIDAETVRSVVGNLYVSIGRAYLQANDPSGLRYYARGLAQARGVHNKARAAAGLFLLAMPRKLRRPALKVFYRATHALPPI